MSAPTKPHTGSTSGQRRAGHGEAAANSAAQPKRVAPEQLTGAQSVIRSLEELDVEVIFGIPGGAVLPVYDPLFDSQKLRHVLVRHEQGAGHAASGYAHATGKVGVCMATSGPGATNLVTPLADAQMDSIPVVAITGQVGRGADRHRRLPGGRHLRHHDADHQAQLPGPLRRRHSPGDGRGLPHRGLGTPGRGARRHPQGRAAGPVHVQLAAADGSARLQAEHQTAQPADPRGRQADRGRAQTGALRRRWRHPRRGDRAAARSGRTDRHPGRHHADGARRVSGQPPRRTWACPACTARWPRWRRCSAATC